MNLEVNSPKTVQSDDFNPLSGTSDLLVLLPPKAKVIVEIGCRTGEIAAKYKQINPKGFYVGVALNSSESVQDHEKLDRLIQGEIQALDITSLGLEVGTVDCLIYDQTLGHLENLLATLKQQTNWLQEEGQVIASIPNVQHWRKIVNLLQGKWQNEPRNILSELGRFPQHEFTLEKIQALFQSAGLSIYEIQTRGQKDEQFKQFLEFCQPLVQALKLDRNRFATQTAAERYLVRAIKSSKSPRRLLIQTIMMAPTACDRLRVLEPDQFSKTIPGTRAVSAAKSFPTVAAIPDEEKVWIWQRTIMSYQDHLPQLKSLIQRDYLIIAEIDDNPLRRQEYADNHYLSYRGCHGVQTSTEPLAVFLRKLNPNVAVFHNQLAYLPPPRKYSEDVVTLFFGALNREKDWRPIMAGLNRVLAMHKNRIRVKVIYDRKFFDSLETDQKDFEPFCSYERYQEILHLCDIGLLPLGPTPVNLMKSDLKFLECAGHGVAVLASPTVYEQSIIAEETGLIYRTLKQFETQLNELILNTQLRHQIAANAYAWVRDNRLLCHHYTQRRQWYLQMRDRLPELNQQLRQRVPELFVN